MGFCSYYISLNRKFYFWKNQKKINKNEKCVSHFQIKNLNFFWSHFWPKKFLPKWRLHPGSAKCTFYFFKKIKVRPNDHGAPRRRSECFSASGGIIRPCRAANIPTKRAPLARAQWCLHVCSAAVTGPRHFLVRHQPCLSKGGPFSTKTELLVLKGPPFWEARLAPGQKVAEDQHLS